MELIPAIDMMDGKCVRLSQGKFDQVTVFADDPSEMAKKWEAEGASRLHLVDLNGSRAGAPQETQAIKKIIKSINIPVELGGGIRTLKTAKEMLELGVGRVIIGTSAAKDSDLAEAFFKELGEQAVLGVDAKDGHVAISGWEQVTKETAVEFTLRMQNLGAKRVIYTDISRDGMLKGVNLPAMAAMAKALTIPVIASGGVTNIDDIKNLSKFESVGIEGAILGKALYTGNLNFSEALSALGD